ncbi:MAG: hypothetical protein WKF73_18840 [Nocardioidaceae bacterium]
MTNKLLIQVCEVGMGPAGDGGQGQLQPEGAGMGEPVAVTEPDQGLPDPPGPATRPRGRGVFATHRGQSARPPSVARASGTRITELTAALPQSALPVSPQ